LSGTHRDTDPSPNLEKDTTVRVRPLLAGGLLAAGIGAVGIGVLAGPASAHDLTGGSAQATCVGETAQVTWTFVSENAGDHAIQTVLFDRSVSSSSHTANTVTARTNEPVGTTVSLTATVTFEDQFQSSHTVTTTVPDDLCPPPTTTTVPPTTTTVPPTTTTVVPAQPTVPPTQPPTTVAPTAAPQQVTTAAVHPTALPTTGSSSTVVVIAGLGALLVGGVLLLAGRRGAAE
jgi:LPXTG-motif cell wall-anchored protein